MAPDYLIGTEHWIHIVLSVQRMHFGIQLHQPANFRGLWRWFWTKATLLLDKPQGIAYPVLHCFRWISLVKVEDVHMLKKCFWAYLKITCGKVWDFTILEQFQKLPAAFGRSKHCVFRTFSVHATAETIWKWSNQRWTCFCDRKSIAIISRRSGLIHKPVDRHKYWTGFSGCDYDWRI